MARRGAPERRPDGRVDLSLEDLSPGDFLEVRGMDDGAGGVQASRVERREIDDVKLRGRVDDFDAARFGVAREVAFEHEDDDAGFDD